MKETICPGLNCHPVLENSARPVKGKVKNLGDAGQGSIQPTKRFCIYNRDQNFISSSFPAEDETRETAFTCIPDLEPKM